MFTQLTFKFRVTRNINLIKGIIVMDNTNHGFVWVELN